MRVMWPKGTVGMQHQAERTWSAHAEQTANAKTTRKPDTLSEPAGFKKRGGQAQRQWRQPLSRFRRASLLARLRSPNVPFGQDAPVERPLRLGK